MNFEQILELSEGPERTAALVGWFQGLFAPDSAPVLVGGGAVELFTDGAYRTGDLDFVGTVAKDVSRKLSESGFRRAGRHWLHEEGQVFLELPSQSLASDATVVTLETRFGSVLSISPEDLVIDRLAAWEFWGSEQDGVNAYLIWRRNDLDESRLERLADARGVNDSLESLRGFRARYLRSEPTAEELQAWAETRAKRD